VNRAFSAGAFDVPRILGRCPQAANERCAFGASLNNRQSGFSAVRPGRHLGEARCYWEVGPAADNMPKFQIRPARRPHWRGRFWRL